LPGHDVEVHRQAGIGGGSSARAGIAAKTSAEVYGMNRIVDPLSKGRGNAMSMTA